MVVLVMLVLAPVPGLPALGQSVGDRRGNLPVGEERGEPEIVELDLLASSGPRYNRQSVRTRGKLKFFQPNPGYLLLADGFAQVLLIPLHDDAREMGRLLGREVEVTGVARELKPPQPDWCRRGHWSLCEEPSLPPLPDLTPARTLTGWPSVSITVFSLGDVTSSTSSRKAEIPRVTLEALVTASGQRDGQIVRVVGRFRGHNLFGDLPRSSRRDGGDWVLKDDLFAVWVTEKKPKGQGWTLDASEKAEAERWVEVVGRPETVRGITYLHAQKVSLATPPRAEAAASTPAREPSAPRPRVAPRIVFAMPLDGDQAVAPDSRFVIQFSKDMEQASFTGRVRLLYTGPPRPGDHAFDAMKVEYDLGRRALVVDPGDQLRAGRELELSLLPGIVDVEGLGLLPRGGREEAGEVLRFKVAGQ